MTPATKPGFDPHDASTCTPISDWQDRGDHSIHCPLQLCSQGSEVRLDLAQQMLLYGATRALPAPTAALPWGAALPVAADPRACLEAAAGGRDRLRGRSVGQMDRWTDRVAQRSVRPPSGRGRRALPTAPGYLTRLRLHTARARGSCAPERRLPAVWRTNVSDKTYVPGELLSVVRVVSSSLS